MKQTVTIQNSLVLLTALNSTALHWNKKTQSDFLFKPQFRRWIFPEPSLISCIKFIESHYLNFERLSRSSRLAQPRLWNGFWRQTFILNLRDEPLFLWTGGDEKYLNKLFAGPKKTNKNCLQTSNVLHMYLIYMCTRLERLKIVKFLLYPDDGKQPKTFGLNFLILQVLTFQPKIHLSS